MFTNLAGGKGRPPIGARAGCLKKHGYRTCDLDGQRYYEHHLAWFYMTGEWPVGRIDHRNTARDQNWFGNLRPATAGQNNCNRTINKTNRLGLKGVVLHVNPRRTKRYGARIKINYKAIHLGWFSTPEEAHAAYVAAAERYFGPFARNA